MNKKQLVVKLSGALNLSKADAERTFDTITNTILDALKADDSVKIAQISGDFAKLGLLPFIMIISYISISLGLFNLFPIPLLDGGHILINTIEGIRGKEFNRKTLENTFRIGIGIIAMLMIFTIFNDINNFLLRYQN